MPKTIMVLNFVLLLCLSALAGSAVVSHLGGVVVVGHCALVTLTIVGVVCGVVMLVSEIFSGIRWVPVVALAGLAVGWLTADGQTAAPRVSEIAWMVGWLSVAVWFAYLAAQARENR